MRYLMFIKSSEHYRNQEIPAGLMKAMGEFVTAKLKSGELIDTAGLKPTSAAKRLRLEGGNLRVTDGPFTESKEMIGGYALVEAKSDADALRIATEFME